MKKLQHSEIVIPPVEGDEQFFARKIRAKDFNGMMDPVIGFDHFETTKNISEPYPSAGIEILNYIFENSAAYQSIDSSGNKITVNAGSLLWTSAGSGIVHSEYSLNENTEVEGLKLFLNIPGSKKHSAPKNLLIDKAQIPEIKKDGVLVKVVCGSADNVVNPVKTPEALTLLHIFLDPEKEFSYTVPAGYSATVFAVEGHFEIITHEQTTELEEGSAITLTDADHDEDIVFEGIGKSQLVVICAKPLREPVFIQDAIAMESLESLNATIENYNSGKMGFVKIEDEVPVIVSPV